MPFFIWLAAMPPYYYFLASIPRVIYEPFCPHCLAILPLFSGSFCPAVLLIAHTQLIIASLVVADGVYKITQLL